MSEFVNSRSNRATIRSKLLTTASALTLAAYVSSTGAARAEDADHPLLWIDLGGQMEQVQGLSAPFTAPFMSLAPASDVYNETSFAGSQRGARFSFGAEGKISFQPEDSDWIFSAGIRYGRSHANRHTHKQEAHPPIQWVLYYYGSPYNTYTATFPAAAFTDVKAQNTERHTILDFMAGKDVGLGMFGREGSSTLSAGVRFASFTANSSVDISGRPSINIQYVHYNKYYGLLVFDVPHGTFDQYMLHASATRSFKGIGPSLSWNASAALLGDAQHGELSLDWGLNASLLFGKQKARTQHNTQAYHYTTFRAYPTVYQHTPPASVRSRSVTVPNIGGFAAFTAQYKDAKVSIGYRVDSFLNAMDTGIDAAKKSNLTFNGPYASISVGLGD